MSDAPADDIAFVRRLMVAAREEGCRRVRVGDVEVEMAVVRNPLAEQQELALAEQRKAKQAEPRQPHDDYLDAMGNQKPVLRRPRPGGGQ